MAQLKPHPTSRPMAISSVSGRCVFSAGKRIDLLFHIDGEISCLRTPPAARSVRGVDLWRTTCVEAFISPRRDDAYWEVNIAPSTEWAFYRFDSYRAGMRDEPDIEDVSVEITRPPNGLTIHAAFKTAALPDAACDIGLSAVTEETNGALSYWALRHPPGKPDFHHPTCFASHKEGS